jgi:hypothetical protein
MNIGHGNMPKRIKVKFENISSPWKKFQNLVNMGP